MRKEAHNDNNKKFSILKLKKLIGFLGEAKKKKERVEKERERSGPILGLIYTKNHHQRRKEEQAILEKHYLISSPFCMHSCCLCV